MNAVHNYSEYLSIKKVADADNVYTFEVMEHHLNEHQTAHGGVLYSICSEAVAMYVSTIEEREGVGAQGSIQYYKAAMLGDILTINVIPRKTGRRMSNYMIEIRNADDKLVADAMFTVAH